MSEKKQVLIDEDKLKRLQERSEWLSCLESAGVDNWEGYDYARELQGDSEEED